MNLASKLEALRRNELVMRLAAFLLCLSLLLGLISPKLEARAFAFAPPAVAAVAAAFLGACGLKVVVDGMDREGLQDAMYKLLKEFLDTELGGITIEEWLGSAWDMTVMLGKIFLGHSLADKLNAFAQWVAGKYGAVVGMNEVYSESSSWVALMDGSKFYLCTNYDESNRKFLVPGTPIERSNFPVIFSTGYSMEIRNVNGREGIYYLNPSGEVLLSHISGFPSWWPMYIGVVGNNVYFMHPYLSTASLFNSTFLPIFNIGVSTSVSESLSIDRAESMSYMPELEADQGIALDVGAAGTMDETAVLQGVLDDVLAGELAPTMEAVKEGTENPPVEELPDVGELGLPALGEALTSRFPFSIPWDIAKAIRLLAAPEKAPYFEVDFLEPLADDVGGWQGSTAIVLDFSQYAILGQLSRWTSTIGFCLALASGTKRLIWTA